MIVAFASVGSLLGLRRLFSACCKPPMPGGSGFEPDRGRVLGSVSNRVRGRAEGLAMAPASANLWLPSGGSRGDRSKSTCLSSLPGPSYDVETDGAGSSCHARSAVGGWRAVRELSGVVLLLFVVIVVFLGGQGQGLSTGLRCLTKSWFNVAIYFETPSISGALLHGPK